MIGLARAMRGCCYTVGALAVMLIAAAAQAQDVLGPPIDGPGSTLSLAKRTRIAGVKPMLYGLQLMARFDLLPTLRDTRCVQDSSYDRSGGNGDSGNFFRRVGNRAILSDIRGPGCIYRFWSANAQGTLRIFFDGEKTPRIECPMQDLFLGKYAPFVEPIVGHKSGGWYCFFPMPFRKSCRIEVTDPGSMYYHVQYQLFPDGTPVRTFTRMLSRSDAAALTTIVTQWNGLGSDPNPPADTMSVAGSVSCGGGQTVPVTTVAGPARIVHIHLKADPANRFSLRSVVLRVYWDGSNTPGIESPIGDLFGSGFGDQRFKALPDEMTDDGYDCYWPMPFSLSARFEVQNYDPTRAVDVAWKLTYQTETAPEQGVGYFHAQWHRETTTTGHHFHILRATGRGHYVGEHTAMQGDRGIWFLEGDEKLFVDGETFPSIHGTGTEDFYTGGWYFDEGPFNRAYHGCIVKDDSMSRVGAYRYQIQDCVPFQHQISVEIEHGPVNDYPGADYSCVAYWYQDAPGGNWSPIDPAQLVPARYKLQGVIEAEDLPWSGAGATVTSDREYAEASGGKLVAISAGHTSTTLTAPADDVYTVVFGLLQAPDAAPTFGVTLPGDAMAVDVKQPDNAGPAFNVSRVVRLPKGSSDLMLTVPDGAKLYLDYIHLEPSPKRDGVTEAESLIADAHVTGGSIRRIDRPGSDWSGWSGLEWRIDSPSSTLDLPVSAPSDGSYSASVRVAQIAGSLSLYGALDGGLPADGRALTLDAGAAHGGFNAPLPFGWAPQLKAGAHTLRLFAADARSGSTVVIDFITFRRSLYANAIEAEDLPVLDTKDGDAQEQDLSADHWSNGRQLFFMGRKPGAEVSLGLYVPAAGRYSLSVCYTTARDYGIVQALVDGAPVAGAIDCCTPQVLARGKLTLGALSLTAGQHRLTFRAVDKSRLSIGYFLGVDAIVLDPLR